MTRSNTLIYIYDFTLYVFYFFFKAGDKYFIIKVCVCESEFLRLLCVGKALLVGSFVSSYLSVSKTEAQVLSADLNSPVESSQLV